MVRIGFVGTGAVSVLMRDAVCLTDGAEFGGVYSRSRERGRAFAEPARGGRCYETLCEMLGDDGIDAVYIATPNSCHFSSVRAALLARRHVICEKPLCVRTAEMSELFKTAEENGVFLFEAISTVFMPDFIQYKKLLSAAGKIDGGVIRYGKISSKYDAYLRGESPSVFDPRMDGGALCDLGIYCFHAAASLLGKPERIFCEKSLGRGGVDLSARVTLEYRDFYCTVQTAKDRDMENGCFFSCNGKPLSLPGPLNSFGCEGNRLVYELFAFCDGIKKNDTQFYLSQKEQTTTAAAMLENALNNTVTEKHNVK